jgi:hypothetical protein
VLLVSHRVGRPTWTRDQPPCRFRPDPARCGALHPGRSNGIFVSHLDAAKHETRGKNETHGDRESGPVEIGESARPPLSLHSLQLRHDAAPLPDTPAALRAEFEADLRTLQAARPRWPAASLRSASLRLSRPAPRRPRLSAIPIRRSRGCRGPALDTLSSLSSTPRFSSRRKSACASRSRRRVPVSQNPSAVSMNPSRRISTSTVRRSSRT